MEAGKGRRVSADAVLVAPSAITLATQVTVEARARLDASRGRLELGRGVRVGAEATVSAPPAEARPETLRAMPTVIGQDTVLGPRCRVEAAWGEGSIVYDGAVVLDGAALPAGAIVPPFVVVAGVPATVIAQRGQ